MNGKLDGKQMRTVDEKMKAAMETLRASRGGKGPKLGTPVLVQPQHGHGTAK